MLSIEDSFRRWYRPRKVGENYICDQRGHWEKNQNFLAQSLSQLTRTSHHVIGKMLMLLPNLHYSNRFHLFSHDEKESCSLPESLLGMNVVMINLR